MIFLIPIIPMVFIFILLIWFLIVSIMDKNIKLIIRLSIIILVYSAVFGGGTFILFSIAKQFI
jgi:hypothetical protein